METHRRLSEDGGRERETNWWVSEEGEIERWREREGHSPGCQ